MSNTQKITEIIDEKALQQWSAFVDSLSKGQDAMAKAATEAVELNKKLSSATTLSKFSKDAEQAALSLEKLAQARAKTQIMEQRAQREEMKTIELSEKKARADEKKRLAEESAARSKQRSAEVIVKANKSIQDSEEQTGDFIVQNEKDISRGREAAEAAAISLAAQEKNVAKQREDSSKKLADSAQNERTTLDGLSVSLEGLLRRQMVLKKQSDDLRKSFKEAGDSVSTAEYIEYEKTQRELQEGIRQNNVQIRQFIRLNMEAEGSTDALEQQLLLLRGEYNKLSQSEKETTEEGKKLLETIQNLDKAWKEQKRSVGQNQVDVGNYALAMEALPDSINNVISALQNLQQEDGKITFSGVIAGAKEATKAALAFIATPLGLAITAITAVLAGGKMWYDYNVQLEKATKLTAQLTDLSGDDLKSFRSDVQATADTFDAEFNDTIRAANTLSKEFGISYQEAIDTINSGFVKGANASGQFLDNVKEYSSQFKAAGVSAKDMMAILVRGEKEGIFNDKAADTIKEGTLRLREMTKATKEALAGIGINGAELQKELTSGTKTSFEAIQQVSKALDTVSANSAATGAVLADVFGGAGEDAGLRFISILKDVNTQEVLAAENMTDLEKATLMQLEASETLNKEMADLFDATGGGFETMIAQLKLVGTEILINIIRGVQAAINYFIALYNESILFRSAIAGIGVSFKNTWAVVKTFFSLIFEGFAGFGKGVKAILTGDFESLGGIIANTAKNLKGEIIDLGNEMGGNLADGINQALRGRIDPITGGLDTTDALTKGRTPAGSNSTSAGNATAEDVKAATDAAKKAFEIRKALENRKIELAIATLNKEKQILDEIAVYSQRIYSNENNSFNDRFSALTDYYDEKKKIIDKDFQIQTEGIKKQRNEAKQLLQEGKKEEYLVELEIIKQNQEGIRLARVAAENQLQKEIGDQTLTLLRSRYGNEIELSGQMIEERILEEKRLASKRYQDGEISEKKYRESLLSIDNEYSKKTIEVQISQTQELLKLAKENGLETIEFEKQIAALKQSLSKKTYEQQASDIDKIKEKEKEAAQYRKQIYEEIGEAAFGLFDALFERQIQDLDNRIQLNEQDKQIELERIESSTLNEEQKAAQKFAIESKFAQKEKQLDDERRKAQEKQARFQKAQSVLQVVTSTAAGIARAFADFPFPVALPISIGLGAIGAAQLATVLASPMPKYFTGTKSSKEGWAHVGEKGTELMITPSGELSFTPSTDTLMNLERGTRIYNHTETKRILSGSKDIRKEIPNFERLERAQRETGRMVVSAINKQKNPTTVITKEGWFNTQSGNNKFSDYLIRNGL